LLMRMIIISIERIKVNTKTIPSSKGNDMASEYHAQVLKSESISPCMRRLTLHGDALKAFPPNQESGYVKMLFGPGSSKVVLRSFTIRAFDEQRSQLTLDIVDHGDKGVAAQWLSQCQPGDDVIVRGPGEKKLVNPKADWFFLAGDMTALPAIAVNLEALPDDATGYAIIQINTEDDKQLIGAPKGVELHWLVNNEPEDSTKLMNAVRQKPWLDGTPYPWFAGEFETMRQVRRYFRDEKSIDRKQMYISSYWKHGDTDEGMKRAKRRDTDA
jgi:NADPH-dependent ferric siderophore reductase